MQDPCHESMVPSHQSWMTVIGVGNLECDVSRDEVGTVGSEGVTGCSVMASGVPAVASPFDRRLLRPLPL